jgi:hypothetical protein
VVKARFKIATMLMEILTMAKLNSKEICKAWDKDRAAL